MIYHFVSSYRICRLFGCFHLEAVGVKLMWTLMSTFVSTYFHFITMIFCNYGSVYLCYWQAFGGFVRVAGWCYLFCFWFWNYTWHCFPGVLLVGGPIFWVGGIPSSVQGNMGAGIKSESAVWKARVLTLVSLRPSIALLSLMIFIVTCLWPGGVKKVT